MTVEIRQLGVGDEAVLERIAEDVFDDAVDPKRLVAYLAEPNQYLIAALKDGEVVGQIRAVICKHPDKADELFVENLGVTPAQQRQGIATELLEVMLGLGKKLGCEEAWVPTERNNTQARKFYESFGVEAEPTVMYSFSLEQALTEQGREFGEEVR